MKYGWKGRRAQLVIAAALFASLAVLSLAAPAPSAGAKPPAFAANPLWDDGRAELSQYEGLTKR